MALRRSQRVNRRSQLPTRSPRLTRPGKPRSALTRAAAEHNPHPQSGRCVASSPSRRSTMLMVTGRPSARLNTLSATISAHSTARTMLSVRWERADCLGLVLTVCAARLDICYELRLCWCAILGLNQSTPGNPDLRSCRKRTLSVVPVRWVRFTRCRRQAPIGQHANPRKQP